MNCSNNYPNVRSFHKSQQTNIKIYLSWENGTNTNIICGKLNSKIKYSNIWTPHCYETDKSKAKHVLGPSGHILVQDILLSTKLL